MEAVVVPTGMSIGLARHGHSNRAYCVVRMRYGIGDLRLRVLPTLSISSPRTSINRPCRIAASFEDTASVGVDKSRDFDATTSDASNPEASAAEATKALDEQTEKSKAVLDDVVNNLKDVLKVQDSTKQAYAENAEKAIGVLKDTTEQLREQAEKARSALLATAQETAEKSKENLNMLAKNSSDPLLKDIAETALNAHFPEETKSGAKIHDFCLGIPYGGALVASGLLWFLITGSTAALRFGVFAGAIILAWSVTSLRVWKRGESSMVHIIGQTVTTTILAMRELRRYSEVQKFFPHGLMAFLSVGMLVFYAYVMISGGNPPKKAKQAQAHVQ